MKGVNPRRRLVEVEVCEGQKDMEKALLGPLRFYERFFKQRVVFVGRLNASLLVTRTPRICVGYIFRTIGVLG